MVNSDNNHNEHVKKPKKNKLRTFVLIFVLSSLVTLIVGSVDHGRKVLHTKWLQKQPVHDLFGEHLVSLFAGVVRPKLYNWGVDYGNWLQLFLKEWHRSAYESALEKIPEEDGERILWWREYEFAPHFKVNDHGKSNAELMQRTIKFYKKLQNAPIASPWMDQVERYVAAYAFLHHFVFHKTLHNLSREQFLYNNDAMISTTVAYLKDMDADVLLKEPLLVRKMHPLHFYRTAFLMFVEEFEEGRFTCGGDLVGYFVFVKEGLSDLFRRYESVEMDKEKREYYINTIHLYGKNLPKVQKIVETKCNTNI